MITIELARRLRDAGTQWHPANGDRFFIPDRDLDDRVFSISEMSVEVRHVPGDEGPQIAFNGTVEWALDAIEEREVVWLPSETQLRELLGGHFVALLHIEGGFRCEINFAGQRLGFEHPQADGAYALALLHSLEHGVESLDSL